MPELWHGVGKRSQANLSIGEMMSYPRMHGSKTPPRYPDSDDDIPMTPTTRPTLADQSWVEDAHGAVVLLSDAEDALAEAREALAAELAALRKAAQKVIDEHRSGFWSYATMDALDRALAIREEPSDAD